MQQTARPLELTKRENQIMAALYRHGASTIAVIAEHMPSPPSDTALRTLMRILEDKGYVSTSQEGRRNVYTPVIEKDRAAMPALKHVLDTFFGGSLSGAVAAHLSDPGADIDAAELARLRKLAKSGTGHADKGGT